MNRMKKMAPWMIAGLLSFNLSAFAAESASPTVAVPAEKELQKATISENICASPKDSICRKQASCDKKKNTSCNKKMDCSKEKNLCDKKTDCGKGKNLCDKKTDCSKGKNLCDKKTDCGKGKNLCDKKMDCSKEKSTSCSKGKTSLKTSRSPLAATCDRGVQTEAKNNVAGTSATNNSVKAPIAPATPVKR